MDLGLSGRVALVTGSSRGLGFASAQSFVEEGAAVVLTSRSPENLSKAEQELGAVGGQTLAIAGDLSDPLFPANLVDATLERFGRLDVLVANNGGPPPGSSLEVTDSQLASAFEANFFATVRLVRAALPVMSAAGWGRICAITSYAVVQPIPTLACSNAARTALRAWAKTAAADVAEQGVTLNLICPGLHRTDRMVELGATGLRAGDPTSFGRIVAFMCSEPASYLNGATVVVDGGATVAL